MAGDDEKKVRRSRSSGHHGSGSSSSSSSSNRRSSSSSSASRRRHHREGEGSSASSSSSSSRSHHRRKKKEEAADGGDGGGEKEEAEDKEEEEEKPEEPKTPEPAAAEGKSGSDKDGDKDSGSSGSGSDSDSDGDGNGDSGDDAAKAKALREAEVEAQMRAAMAAMGGGGGGGAAAGGGGGAVGGANIQDERDALEAERRAQGKMKARLLGAKFKVKERRLSAKAFAIGPDLTLTEEELDETVVKMCRPSTRGGLATKTITIQKGFDPLLCFDGHSATQWVQQQYGLQQKDAVHRAQTWFVNRGVWRSVSKSHASFHNDKETYYRLSIWDAGQAASEVIAATLMEKDSGAAADVKSEHEGEDMTREKQLVMFRRSRNVLNLGKLPQTTVEDPCALARELCQRVVKLLAAHAIDDDGEENGYDFEAMAKDPDYVAFQLRAALLQRLPVDFEDMDNDDKIVFFVNLFNVLWVHACVAQGEPETMVARAQRIQCAYELGGAEYTADTIYALLRGAQDAVPTKNARVRADFSPLGKLKQKKMKSAGTLRVALSKRASTAEADPDQPTNPEIHFVIFNGTRASPPIRVMTVDRLNAIEACVDSYINRPGNIDIDIGEDTVRLPNWIKPFVSDFGEEPRDILRAIIPLVKDKKARRYLDAYEATCDVVFSENDYDNPHYLPADDEGPPALLESSGSDSSSASSSSSSDADGDKAEEDDELEATSAAIAPKPKKDKKKDLQKKPSNSSTTAASEDPVKKRLDLSSSSDSSDSEPPLASSSSSSSSLDLSDELFQSRDKGPRGLKQPSHARRVRVRSDGAKDIGVYGAHTDAVGTNLLRAPTLDQEGTADAADRITRQLQREKKRSADEVVNRFVAHDRCFVDEAGRRALMARVDASVVQGKEKADTKAVLTVAELEAVVGAAAVAEMQEAFGVSIDEVKLRRVSSTPEREVINFHLDFAHRTMGIPLNDSTEYEGSRLLYAIPGEGVVAAPRGKAGSATVHDNTLPHGVTPLTRGVRYGLFLLNHTA